MPVYPYISFGPSDLVPDDADLITGREETVQIDIWSQQHGALIEARQIVDAVKGALHKAPPALEDHALVGLEVILARVMLDRDGVTAHGIVQLTAFVEEN